MVEKEIRKRNKEKEIKSKLASAPLEVEGLESGGECTIAPSLYIRLQYSH